MVFGRIELGKWLCSMCWASCPSRNLPTDSFREGDFLVPIFLSSADRSVRAPSRKMLSSCEHSRLLQCRAESRSRMECADFGPSRERRETRKWGQEDFFELLPHDSAIRRNPVESNSAARAGRVGQNNG